jgi:hypothetical protein
MIRTSDVVQNAGRTVGQAPLSDGPFVQCRGPLATHHPQARGAIWMRERCSRR